jgi:hypothetical protein
MMWFFERGTEKLELKTHYDNTTSEYVLEVVAPGESRPEERFPDAPAFRTRLVEIERELGHQQWRPNGSPIVLADGWPDRTPPR